MASWGDEDECGKEGDSQIRNLSLVPLKQVYLQPDTGRRLFLGGCLRGKVSFILYFRNITGCSGKWLTRGQFRD